MSDPVYRENANKYLKRGFKPIPVRGKFPPVVGATGTNGVVDKASVEAWRTTYAEHNIALRAEGWIGIDVDVYKDKHGDRTLANYVERLGPLPKTYSSTARGKSSPSRQYFYRVTGDTKLATKIGNDIEIIQFHHRYAMVEPSVHPDLGVEYAWYDEKGNRAKPPTIDMLPDLPEAWLADLQAAPDSTLLDVNTIEWRQLVGTFAPSPRCHVAQTFIDKVEATDQRDHIGHDDALALALEGFMLGREGHSGMKKAVLKLYEIHHAYVKKARPHSLAEVDLLFNDRASVAQRKPVEDKCTCFTTTAITTIDPGKRKRNAARTPIIKLSGALLTETACKQFLEDHPVKRYVGSLGKTYVWIGDKWLDENIKLVTYRWLRDRIGNEASKRKGDELAWAVLAAAEEITDDDLDRRYISVANGLLEWETGSLIPRTPDIFVVNHLPIAWRPAAQLGKFAEWIHTTVEPEMIPHVWEIIGYAVAPIRDLKVALAFSGLGGGGKSTLVNVMQNLVGKENTANIAPANMGDRFNRVLLHGKILNAPGDVGSEMIRNVGVLKSIIAGDMTSAENKGVDGFSFRPNIFTVAAFNVLPSTESNDSGFWDRWLVLAFKHRFADETNHGDNYWRDEMPFDQSILEGVFVEAVTALRRLRARGQFDRTAFAPAKAQWRQEVDSVAAFATERLVLDADGVIVAKTLHELYSRVELGNGGQPRKNRTFYRELLAYYDEQSPRAVTRSPGYANASTIYGLKILHNDDADLYQIDPDKTYGPEGWVRPRRLLTALN